MNTENKTTNVHIRSFLFADIRYLYRLNVIRYRYLKKIADISVYQYAIPSQDAICSLLCTTALVNMNRSWFWLSGTTLSDSLASYKLCQWRNRYRGSMTRFQTTFLRVVYHWELKVPLFWQHWSWSESMHWHLQLFWEYMWTELGQNTTKIWPIFMKIQRET